MMLNRKHEMFLNNLDNIPPSVLQPLNRKHEMFLNIIYKSLNSIFNPLNRKHEMFLNFAPTSFKVFSPKT